MILPTLQWHRSIQLKMLQKLLLKMLVFLRIQHLFELSFLVYGLSSHQLSFSQRISLIVSSSNMCFHCNHRLIHHHLHILHHLLHSFHSLFSKELLLSQLNLHHSWVLTLPLIFLHHRQAAQLLQVFYLSFSVKQFLYFSSLGLSVPRQLQEFIQFHQLLLQLQLLLACSRQDLPHSFFFFFLLFVYVSLLLFLYYIFSQLGISLSQNAHVDDSSN